MYFHERSGIATPLFLVLLYAAAFACGFPLVRKNWQHEVGPHAQCLTHITEGDKAEFEQGLNRSRHGLNSEVVRKRQFLNDTQTFVFNVSFTIVFVNETLAGGWVPDEHVEAQVKTLNADFNGTGISWNLVKTTRVNNSDWFVNTHPGSYQEQAMKHMYKVGDAATLNVYTVTFNKTTKSLGAASIPSAYYRDPISDGILIRHSTLPGGSREHFNLGRTLTHEVGHWLGLFHTFEGGCDHGVGDNVADTPPAASGSEGCPVGRDSCPGDGPDLINNFMDYSYDSCMSSFTKGQAERMREAANAFRRPGSKTAPPPKAKPSSA
ncbi:hypothetical protein B0H34DRAFT_706520 [Crassisporium funariophilum]|nr:hypothetical protein B0H34DRAFT_706520 [Crassisporium funariophilum]